MPGPLVAGEGCHSAGMLAGARELRSTEFIRMQEPARASWTVRGRIGLMSTQRPENRPWVASRMDTAKGTGRQNRDSVTLYASARTRGLTAWLALPARWAINSLQSDHHNTQLVRLVGRGWLLLGLGRRTQAVPSAFIQVILSAQPHPSSFARLHRALSQLPAARGRRTERCDGKRNLYFQYAA